MSASITYLFEDEFLFVVSKPSCLHSVMLKRSANPSLAEQLIALQPTLAEAAPKTEDAGLVQRLDYETSGLLLGAKTQDIWKRLFMALKLGTIHKEYVALLSGQVTASFSVDCAIGTPSRQSNKVRAYPAKPRKKDRALSAHSEFSPLRYFKSSDCTLCRVIAKTARRHQIRAHAAFNGHALIGDSLYGDQRILKDCAAVNTALLQPEQSFILHAEKLCFVHPISSKKISLTQPLAEGLLKA